LFNLLILSLVSTDDNEVTGTIPTEIGALDELKELYLGENELTGTIPSELGLLDEVKKLYLSKFL